MDLPVIQPTPSFPLPLVVADVGGTNVRLATIEAPGAPLRAIGNLRTADFPGPAEAIRSATSGAAAPRSVVLCGAGPIDGRRCQLTNAAWTIDGDALAADLSLGQGLLLNDFEAQALSLPAIPADGLLTIGPDHPAGKGPRLVLGPGTGLGVGALVNAAGRHVPVASEGGHVDLAPGTAEEAAVLGAADPVLGRLTAEAILSGSGLANLHKARCRVRGLADPGLDAAAITRAAQADHQGQEAQSVRMFVALLARYAGDMAITFAATGGVYLAGGILPRIRSLIDHAAFRAAFEAKAPVEWLPRSIATRLIVSPDAVLHGMAAIALRPADYVLDYEGRCWR